MMKSCISVRELAHLLLHEAGRVSLQPDTNELLDSEQAVAWDPEAASQLGIQNAPISWYAPLHNKGA